MKQNSVFSVSLKCGDFTNYIYKRLPDVLQRREEEALRFLILQSLLTYFVPVVRNTSGCQVLSMHGDIYTW